MKKRIGTKLKERLAHGDRGINGLDELCKQHNIAYENNKDSSERYYDDKQLQSGALKRLFSKDASLRERAASLLVSTAMKAKTGLAKFGSGISKSKSKTKKKCKRIKGRGHGNSFNALLKEVQNGLKKSKSKSTKFKPAFRSAKKSGKKKDE